LPFCHVTLRGQKPQPAVYPKELRTLGDHLRKRRLDLGLLQREVAAQISVAKDTISNWEGNATSPDLRMVPRIMRFLGYEPERRNVSPGDRLLACRRSRGLSQSEMARRLGIDPGTLSRWERGRQSRKRTRAARVIGEFLASEEG
jgi:transcriptional regulator with XRE-family HTH domain